MRFLCLIEMRVVVFLSRKNKHIKISRDVELYVTDNSK